MTRSAGRVMTREKLGNKAGISDRDKFSCLSVFCQEAIVELRETLAATTTANKTWDPRCTSTFFRTIILKQTPEIILEAIYPPYDPSMTDVKRRPVAKKTSTGDGRTADALHTKT